MRFKITGANAESGDDVDVMLEAPSQSEVERIAHERGILVSAISPAPADNGAIALVEDEPPPAPAAHAPAHATGAPHAHAPASPGGTVAGLAVAPPAADSHASVHGTPIPADSGNGAHHEHKAGLITVNASNPGDTAHTGEGHITGAAHTEAAMEYHVMLNQSLYLLESAVNKYLRDGWEPQGGIAIGSWNNALQYFQALVRKHKKT